MPTTSKRQFLDDVVTFRGYMGDRRQWEIPEDEDKDPRIVYAFGHLFHVYLYATATSPHPDTMPADILQMESAMRAINEEYERRRVLVALMPIPC